MQKSIGEFRWQNIRKNLNQNIDPQMLHRQRTKDLLGILERSERLLSIKSRYIATYIDPETVQLNIKIAQEVRRLLALRGVDV